MIEFQATYISYMIMGLVGYACGYIICKLRTGYKEDANENYKEEFTNTANEEFENRINEIKKHYEQIIKELEKKNMPEYNLKDYARIELESKKYTAKFKNSNGYIPTSYVEEELVSIIVQNLLKDKVFVIEHSFKQGSEEFTTELEIIVPRERDE